MKAPVCSSVETLEARIAPAGLVAVSVKAGVLILGTVPGQDGNEAVTLTHDANGDLSITPGPDVTLRFNGADSTAPIVVPGPIAGLSVNLGAGNDSVAFDAANFTRSVKLSMGEGDNTISVNSSFFGSKFSVTGGGGADSITATGNLAKFAGAFTAQLGGGTNSINLGATRVSLGNGLKFVGGAGSDSLQLGTTDTFVHVLGAVNFLAGDGANSVTAGEGTGRVDITGAFAFKGGIGSDSISLAGARFGAGALQLKLGDGTNSVTSTAVDVATDRDFVVVGLNGSDTLDFDGSNLRVFGNLAVSLGNGPSIIALQPSNLFEVTGATKIKAGSSDPDASKLNLKALDLLFNGPVGISLGDGFSTCEVFYDTRVLFGKGARIQTGEVTGLVGIRGNGELVSHGSIFVKAEGEATLTVFGSSQTSIDGSVTIMGGKTAGISGVGSISGSVLLLPGNPTAGPEINANAEGFLTAGLRIGGKLTIKVPTSSDQTGRAFVRGIFTTAPAQITMGLGADTVFLGELRIGSSLKVDLGAGADTLNFDTDLIAPGSTVTGPVTILGGAGADLFTLGGANPGSNHIEFRNRVLIDGGADTDAITVGAETVFDADFPLEQKNIP